MKLNKIGLVVLISNLLSLPYAIASDVKLTGKYAISALQKTSCGTTREAVTSYTVFEGSYYARRAGEKDRLLFNILGINTKQCMLTEDPVQGIGYRSVGRELMLFVDTETKELIDQWENPWTNEQIQVVHSIKDPTSMGAIRFERDSDGKEFETSFQKRGQSVIKTVEYAGFYSNPLGGDYQDYIGGQGHSIDFFTNFYDAESLLNPEIETVNGHTLNWSRVSKWSPWLKMGDRDGLIISNAKGFRTFDQNEIPDALMRILKSKYPHFLTPPPLDDQRPNKKYSDLLKEAFDGEK